MLAAFKRQAWPSDAGAPNIWPQVFQDSRRWCFLKLKPGTEPLRALVEPFLRHMAIRRRPIRDGKNAARVDRSLLDGKATLRDLLNATERR